MGHFTYTDFFILVRITFEGPEMKFVDFNQVLVILRTRHIILWTCFSWLFQKKNYMRIFIKLFPPQILLPLYEKNSTQNWFSKAKSGCLIE